MEVSHNDNAEIKRKADAWQMVIACQDGVGQDFALSTRENIYSHWLTAGRTKILP